MKFPLCLGPALAVALLAGCSRPEPTPEPVRAVRTMTVAVETAGGAHEYAGDVRARTESRLSFRVAGKMVRRIAEVGQHVKAGQPLAELDPEDMKLGQSAAQAALQSAQAGLALAEADFRRYKDLREQDFISAAELERREAALKSAQAQFEQARAQAAVQGNQVGYGILAAAASGVVTAVDAEPGAVLAAGATVLRLAHDGPRDAVFAVPEDAAGFLRALLDKPGALSVRIWGEPKWLPATVREIAAAADPSTRTFQVKADLAVADVQIGRTATVLLELPRREGVIKLPLTAVTQLQGKTSVWLVDKASMTVRPQPVVVGGAEGNSVIVATGLGPGEVVVTAGVHLLTPGQKVKFFEAPVAAR